MRGVWAVLAAGLLVTGGCDRDVVPRGIGKPAPEFTVTNGAETVDLAGLRGKVVLLNFWATWCAPCVQEVPALNTLQRDMPEVVILGVSTDDDEGAYRKFLSDKHIVYRTIRDGDQKANLRYGTVQFPETYVIDRDGVMRRKFIGAQDWASPEIEGYLKRLEGAGTHLDGATGLVG